MPLNLLHVCNV